MENHTGGRLFVVSGMMKPNILSGNRSNKCYRVCCSCTSWSSPSQLLEHVQHRFKEMHEKTMLQGIPWQQMDWPRSSAGLATQTWKSTSTLAPKMPISMEPTSIQKVFMASNVANDRLSIEVGDMFFCSHVTMKKLQIVPCLSNHFRTFLFSCEKIAWNFNICQMLVMLSHSFWMFFSCFSVWHFGTSQNPSFSSSLLQQHLILSWGGILKKDSQAKWRNKHPGWVHNDFCSKRNVFFTHMSRSIQNSFDIGNRGCFWKGCLKMKPLTSAPRIHGSSFRCPATETAWNFKSFLGDPRFMKAFLFDTWPFLGRKRIRFDQPRRCQPLGLQFSCSRLISFSFRSSRASVALRASKCPPGIKTFSTQSELTNRNETSILKFFCFWSLIIRSASKSHWPFQLIHGLTRWQSHQQKITGPAT